MRLELNRTSDYAVRAMCLLARSGGSQLSSTRIAERTGISSSFVVPIMSSLVRAGLAEGTVGRTGGYRLRGAPRDISVLEIVNAVEGKPPRTACALVDGPCRAAMPCALHAVLTRANDAFLVELGSVALADIVAEQIALERAQAHIPARARAKSVE